MNGSRMIFIGGIHGVGKGRICKTLCDQDSITYLSASKLIKWEEVSPDIRNKKVEDIPNTQERLISALSVLCEEGKTYLLDGHYCLLDSDSKIARVPMDVFSLISPKVLILVSAEPEVVVERLESRDSKTYDLNLISKMLSQEFDYSYEIRDLLGVELYHITMGNSDEMIKQLKEIL